MPLVLRWFYRVTFGFVVIIGVTAAIGCIVAVATGEWAALPGQLIFVLALAFMIKVRFSRRTATRNAGRARVTDAARGTGRDGLTSLRSLAATFAACLILFGVVIAGLPDLPDGAVVPWIPLLVVVAVVCVVVPSRAEQPLDCSSPTQLAGSYRTRFFVRIAFAECPALFAFTFVFIGAPMWTYYVGAACSLFRIATHVAPTRAALARDQAALDADGCRCSLVAALTSTAAI